MKFCSINKLILAILLTLSSSSYASKSQVIEISNELIAKITPLGEKDGKFPANIEILQKKSGLTLLKIKSQSFDFWTLALDLDIDDNKMVANLSQLNPEEEHAIVFADFNFDGKKDLAIQVDKESCYNGPSYKIFLAAPNISNKFLHNRSFSTLAQDYCGMFEIDTKRKLLLTYNKSGYTRRETGEFVVIHNKPKLIRLIEEFDKTPQSTIQTITTWRGKKKFVKTTIIPPPDR